MSGYEAPEGVLLAPYISIFLLVFSNFQLTKTYDILVVLVVRQVTSIDN
jgi:hypothetical protein